MLVRLLAGGNRCYRLLASADSAILGSACRTVAYLCPLPRAVGRVLSVPA
jgi:hypothetical protein